MKTLFHALLVTIVLSFIGFISVSHCTYEPVNVTEYNAKDIVSFYPLGGVAGFKDNKEYNLYGEWVCLWYNRKNVSLQKFEYRNIFGFKFYKMWVFNTKLKKAYCWAF